jgi:methylmalonyl-CoA/ethylmalonyl-CoA epimerase
MPAVKRIDHVAIVVEDIETALGFWRDSLGLELDRIEDVPEQKSTVAFLPTGMSEVELVRPTAEDTGVARYLQKHGPGMHHLCFEVEDIEDVLAGLKEKGVRLINETPMTGSEGKKLAFIHPESTQGVLVELYELASQRTEIQLERTDSPVERMLTRWVVLGIAALAFLRTLRRNAKKKERNLEKEESITEVGKN